MAINLPVFRYSKKTLLPVAAIARKIMAYIIALDSSGSLYVIHRKTCYLQSKEGNPLLGEIFPSYNDALHYALKHGLTPVTACSWCCFWHSGDKEMDDSS